MQSAQCWVGGMEGSQWDEGLASNASYTLVLERAKETLLTLPKETIKLQEELKNQFEAGATHHAV